MKIAGTIYLLILPLILSGCIADSLSHCIDENLTLHFEYRDGEDRERLAEEVETIDLVLFDAAGVFYRWIPIETKDLEPGNNLRLELPAGDYHVVAWGNNHKGKDALHAIRPTDELTRLVLPIIGGETIDPLFYAPDLRDGDSGLKDVEDAQCRVTVQKNKLTEHTVSFMPAFHRLNVYLRNFPDVSHPTHPMPYVDVGGFADTYDASLRRGETKGCRLRQSVKEYTHTDSKLIHGHAGFNLPHFLDDDDVSIDIEGTGYSLGLTMQQVLQELDMKIADGKNQTIDVLLTFDGVHVKITQPEWIKNDVGGGIAK